MSENYAPHPDYQLLPEAIQSVISPKQYAWLDDESRRRLEHDLTTPEVAED